LLAIVCVALLGPWLAPFAPLATDITARLLPPHWLPGGRAAYLLGTDQVGRDILSRIIFGGRVPLLVGTLAVLLSAVIGMPLTLQGSRPSPYVLKAPQEARWRFLLTLPGVQRIMLSARAQRSTSGSLLFGHSRGVTHQNLTTVVETGYTLVKAVGSNAGTPTGGFSARRDTCNTGNGW
jgi:hypothetical protein